MNSAVLKVGLFAMRMARCKREDKGVERNVEIPILDNEA